VLAGTDTNEYISKVVKKKGQAHTLNALLPVLLVIFASTLKKWYVVVFSLKADSVEELEGSDGDGTLGVIGRRGVLAVGEKLFPVRLIATASTLTKVDRNGVEAVRCDDDEFLPLQVSMGAASVVRVSKLHP
jgi:hypothetical protein